VARSIRVLSLSAVVGVLSGLAAAALDALLELGTASLIDRVTQPGGPDVLQFHPALLLYPALGGLFSGLVLLLFAPDAHGQGTDQLVHSFHHRDGRLPLRGPLVKALAAVGVIASGGSVGPEGPIASLGAAIGSSTAQAFGLTPRERRALLIAGCAGGVGAIFGCPLGGALFAAGILYREPEFESEALVPAFIASIVSYSTFLAFDRYGTHLLKNADRLVFASPLELPVYLLLGAVCGLVGILFSVSIATAQRHAGRLNALPVWLRPAVGGFLTGVIALALPQVMDNGYRFVQNALDGSLFAHASQHTQWLRWTMLFGMVAIAKCVATAFTVGSGASGGVLGPSVFIGGVAGAFVGALVQTVAPTLMTESLRASLVPVGMAGVLSASMRVPIASMVMVIEMTGSYGLVVPLMLVTTTAYLVGRHWGLIDEQVATGAESPAHAGDAMIHLLESYLVSDVMERNWPFIAAPGTRLSELLARLQSGTRPHFAVLRDDRLVGLISVTDILQLADEAHAGAVIVADDIMTRRLIILEPNRTLYEALRTFQEHNVDVLPVVANGGRRNRHRLLGMLVRDDVFALVRRHMDDLREHVLHEHSALGAIDEDNQLGQLLSGLPAPELGTIERMPIPPEMHGRSLLDADFRNTYRVEVIAIQTAGGQFVCPPDPRLPLHRGDHLLVLTAHMEVEGSTDANRQTSGGATET